MLVLGIETSCDETAVALFEGQQGSILAHIEHTEAASHADFGGVVPELASRDHIRYLWPSVQTVLREAGVSREALGGIAYTAGPGLMGALLVGAAFGRSLAYALGCPSIGVHHLEGHLLAPMLEPTPPEFPFLALLVSGGHTLLLRVAGVGHYELLGESVDDAVGEAFDKTARVLGLGYPGGPLLAKLAEQGDPARFKFPRPMTDRPGLDFSFSGLKTFALTTYQKHHANDQDRADIARAFEEAAVDTLVIKTRRAMAQTGIERVVIAGGVGANKRLRAALQGDHIYYPRPEFCTDNAAMIAYAGYQRLQAGQNDSLEISARARWSLSDVVQS